MQAQHNINILISQWYDGFLIIKEHIIFFILFIFYLINKCLKFDIDMIGFPIEILLRGIALKLRPREAIKCTRNCAEFRATELLFLLKNKNLNYDLEIYAADTRMEISL